MNIDRTDIFMRSLGADTYRVGGSVRDELLGRAAKDADYIVCKLPLNSLKQRLRDAAAGFNYAASITPLKLRDGRQGGWRVSAKGLGLIEIMLPRTDQPRPCRAGENAHQAFDIVVDPHLPLEVDAKRRDFTFNAIYKPLVPGNIIDPTGRGLYDLEHRLIHTTHSSSFADDPLRTLRALRFMATLGYDLSANAEREMRHHAAAVTGLSQKGYVSGTVYDELSKMLMGADCAKALRTARDTGVLAYVLPELAAMLGFEQGSRYHDLTTDEHTFTALKAAAAIAAPLRVRWALLFHDSGKPEAAWVGPDGRTHYYANGETEDHETVSERLWLAAARRLNVPAALRRDVAALIRDHMVPAQALRTGVRMRRARVKYGDLLLSDLLLHRACDLAGKGTGAVVHDQLKAIEAMEDARIEAWSACVPISVRDLSINGHDVISLGAAGREVGRILAAVLDEVVCDPSDLKRTGAWQLARAEALR